MVIDRANQSRVFSYGCDYQAVRRCAFCKKKKKKKKKKRVAISGKFIAEGDSAKADLLLNGKISLRASRYSVHGRF
jgi:hypothetical protein